MVRSLCAIIQVHFVVIICAFFLYNLSTTLFNGILSMGVLYVYEDLC